MKLKKKKKREREKFPFWLSGLRAWHSIHEDVGFVYGLSQWVKDPALAQAAV